jgi:hypothetical protein
MRKHSWIFLLSLCLSLHGFAASSDSDADDTTPPKHKTAKAKKTSKKDVKSQNAKKKTVGELLKQADRGAQVQLAPKKQVALPTFNEKIVQAPHHATTQADLAQVKPPRTSSFMEEGSDDKAKLEKITDQQIQELFKLTQKFKDSPRRGELWLRLAELYVEKAGIIDFRKQNDYDAKLKDFLEGKTKVKPHLDLADAREYNRKAIQLYEWFVLGDFLIVICRQLPLFIFKVILT